ncbi:hypothetical protein HAPAU_03610 [Halalkalicoccus paucihalophilus]|uniref:Uncharacterized protein n=1 Tax=Halalkalicoccus paucihalophilus TaxID=1008153 RepID=A0A151AJ86_9EURY|nr:hypothetical protein [Halalkalicoccus paucihalophilus]KYH27693.1 hypothetical protein HAPAU_03610 [Halalkalicoccus paucihalophilus]
MNESTRSRAVKNRFRDPEVTIAAGLLAIGAAIYTVETYLSPTLLMNDGNPATFAAVFGAMGLLYLAVLLVSETASA